MGQHIVLERRETRKRERENWYNKQETISPPSTACGGATPHANNSYRQDLPKWKLNTDKENRIESIDIPVSLNKTIYLIHLDPLTL
jgi:hypothetical protein